MKALDWAKTSEKNYFTCLGSVLTQLYQQIVSNPVYNT